MLAQLAALDAPAAALAGVRAARRHDCELLPDVAPALELFDALATQWRWLGGMAGAQRTGLDYAAVETVLRLKRIPRQTWSERFADLQVMERAALEAWREEAQRRA